MSDTTTDTNYRQERIERLLAELKYEITRGMIEGEIDERLLFRFVVPVSKQISGGMVICEFRTRPVDHYHYGPLDIEERMQPKLKVVE